MLTFWTTRTPSTSSKEVRCHRKLDTYWNFTINDSNTFSIEMKPVLGGWEMLHFSLSLMNRLNQTDSAIFIFLFWFGCSRRIDFFQNFSKTLPVDSTDHMGRFKLKLVYFEDRTYLKYYASHLWTNICFKYVSKSSIFFQAYDSVWLSNNHL